MKNNKTLAISLAVSIALGLSACGEKTSQEYMELGQASIEQSNAAEAIVQFKNAVRVEPKNVKAREGLGLAYLAQGTYISADKELERAVELGASSEKVIVGLAIARAKLSDRDGVQILLDNYGNLSDESYQGLLFYAGVAALNDNDLSQGQDLLGQSAAIGEATRYGKLSKSYSLYANREIEQALTYTSSLLEDNELDTEALILNGHLLHESGKYEEASKEFAKHLSLVPTDYAITYFEIKSLLSAENFEQAEQKVDKLLILFKESPLAFQYKSQLEFEKGNYREAMNFADKAVNSGLGFTIARMVAGASAYYENEFEQSYSYLKPLESILPNTHALHRLLAAVKVKLGYTEEVAQSFELISDLNESDINLMQQSTAAMIQARDFLSAQKLIEKAQQIAPESAELEAQRGQLLLAQNNASGLDALERALLLDPSLDQVEASLAMQYLRFDKDKKAIEIADNWLKSSDNKVAGLLLQGVIFTKSNQLEKAKAAYQQVIEVDGNDITALYSLGLIARSEKEFATASTFFEKVIKLEPKHSGALTYLSQLSRELGEEDQLITLLEQIYRENKDNLPLVLGLAQNYRNKGEVAKALELLEGMQSQKGLTETYWTILGDTFTKEREFLEAEESYSKGIKEFPNSYVLRLRNIGLLEINAKYQQAFEQTVAAKSVFVGDQRFEVLEAYLALRSNNIPLASKLAKELDSRNIDNPLMSVVKGQLALIDQDFEKATNYFNEAYEHRSNGGNAINLARSLKFSGEQQEAERVLEKHVAAYLDPKTRVLLAQLYSDKDVTKKIEQLELANSESPENPLILNNLAWAYFNNGTQDKAQSYIEAAYNLDKEYVAIKETYGVILSVTDDKEKAITLLRDAMRSGGNDLNARLVLAKLLVSKQQPDKVKEVLESIKTDDVDIQRQKLAIANSIL